MSNNLMNFEGHNVEVFEWNGQVLFNPRHVGECLGLGESAVKMAISKMNEKQVIKLTNSKVKDIDFRKLHNTGENFLTESGVYKLIFKSNKEKAEKFQDWVTDEVLPTIRKTGGMVVEGREEEFVNNYFPSFSEEVKLGMVQDLLKKNKELKPKADYYDKVLMPTDEDNNFTKLLTVTEVAKDLGISAKKLNNLLHEKGIIFKKGKTWHLYSQHQDKIPEYADYHITEYSQTLKFTEKGRKWILEMLKNEIK